ncbi:class I adenylate-forming enzyme family protein [Sulfitobacter sp. F26169L]|uniref:class I adenylate-forming enzyme family protein n=1 Tax=Sulfitobacter sp. F26169L TaxID=2996015 RepID=UPI002260F543|nr:class I adenylate-forming enzyme family protein [Sulfitobacter sp. F26169L]MCX7567263.1 class I adenylate-forming enzyme family protein [Sulfitobacter sp. F26169L]
MTSWTSDITNLIGQETHFDGRVLRCFTDRPAHLNAMFADAVARAPDAEAVVSGGTRLTYKMLDRRIAGLAGGLQAAGVGRGDRVAILLSNRSEFLTTLLACLRLGAIAVPVNIREGTPELEYILDHCGAHLLVYGPELKDRLPARSALPALEHAVCVDTPEFDRLIDGPPLAAVDIEEETTAVILYTSGTTGRPKGAMLTHFNIIHSSIHFELCMGLGANERSLLSVPASHVTGLIATIFTMVRTAGCTVMMETFRADGFLALAAEENVTQTLMVPAMYNLFLLRCTVSDYDLRHWRIGGYGGAPMPQSTIAELTEKLPTLTLVNAYGATELTSPATIMPHGYGATRADSVGIAVPCGEIRIVDPTGADVPEGEHGELWIKGPMVVPGYWENPEKTASEFTDGYWKSGDVGSRDADGFIRLHDRRKDMVIRGGYNIYSAEIENTLTAHASVIECAVIGRPDPVLGEKIHVFVHTTDAAFDEDAAKAFVRAHLADYKVPDFVSLWDTPLPRNANGKVVKTELRKLV